MTEQQDITVKQLDLIHAELNEARGAHRTQKDITSELWKTYKEKESMFIELLETLGKTEYRSDVGRFYYTFPSYHKLEDKGTFFNYVTEKYGPEVLSGLTTVNSATLNSFCKSIVEEHESSVEVGLTDSDVIIPGINSSVTAAKGHLVKR